MAAIGFLIQKAELQDEISTGLDSSTTYQIVKYLRDLAHTQQNTMLISLLQPAPESYELFDDVLLVAEGEHHHSLSPTL